MGKNNLSVSLSIFCKRLQIHSFKIKAVSIIVAVAAIIIAAVIGHAHYVDDSYIYDLDGNKITDNPRNYAIYMLHNRVDNEHALSDFVTTAIEED